MLLVVGAQGTQSHPLPDEGSVTLGRAEGCDVQIGETSISRQHARIHLGTSLEIEDLGSANGTVVRGNPVTPHQRVPVSIGECVGLGSVIVVVQQGAGHLPRVSSSRGASPYHGHETAPVVHPPHEMQAIVTRDAAMQRLLALVQRVAVSPISVLLLGETGVGKEVLAEAIHTASPRAKAPLMRIHCGAVAPTLLESELFGHEKGAFTDATHARTGLLVAADGGTVFLDEIGEMPLALQVKLLRVLEDRRVQRIGASRPTPIDVRFVAATNVDLAASVAQGTFRRDLYYRLNGMTLSIPPLRERPADIPELARLFLARAMPSSPPALTDGARTALARHPWPGNVRELKNAMERAVIMSHGGPIEPSHLPDEITGAAPEARVSLPPSDRAMDGSLREGVESFERDRIRAALESCGGNQTRAAELLGISRRTLVARLGDYGMPRPRKSRAP